MTNKDTHTYTIPAGDMASTTPADERKYLREWLGVHASTSTNDDGSCTITLSGTPDPATGVHPGVEQFRQLHG